jgi:hypothetical protein
MAGNAAQRAASAAFPPDPVRVARPEHLLPKIMWPTNTFSFCIAKKLRLGRSNAPRRARLQRLARTRHRASSRSSMDALEKVQLGTARNVVIPEAERRRTAYHEDANYLRGRIIGALGGMAAEHEVFDVITTGSKSDLEMVIRIARSMGVASLR